YCSHKLPKSNKEGAMSLFAVLFEDDRDHAAAIRQGYLERHFDFLQANAGAIKVAGPLSRQGDAFAGGLWLVDADDAMEVERLVKADPFWSAGLRASVQILLWNRVFADGAPLLQPAEPVPSVTRQPAAAVPPADR
ncbi:MAG: YciI family protein, partial [Rhizobium sp.]